MKKLNDDEGRWENEWKRKWRYKIDTNIHTYIHTCIHSLCISFLSFVYTFDMFLSQCKYCMVQIHCNFYLYFYFDHFNFLELIIVRMNLILRTIDVRHEIFSMCRLWHSLVYSVLKSSNSDTVNVCQFALGSQFDYLLTLIYTTESRLLLTKSDCFCQIRSLYERKFLSF